MLVKLFFFILMPSFAILSLSSPVLNKRPIIGVLLQDAKDNLSQYVASSYVKFIEMGGARVVPIFIKQNRAYYSNLLSQINGALLPGGSASLRNSGYAKAADLIIKFATFKSGTYFPIVMMACIIYAKTRVNDKKITGKSSSASFKSRSSRSCKSKC